MKLKRLETTSEIIDALGGNVPVGELTGSAPKTVSMWRTLGKFPPKTFVALDRELRSRGYEAPASLWNMVGVEAEAS